jgi:N-methylhydantoinase A
MMARTVGAIREITVERGHDPREFSLLAFGGAGPLFGPLLAREMGIPETIVPQTPAAFSAWGMLMSDLAADYSCTHVALLEETDLAVLDRGFVELEERATASLRRQGIDDASLRLQRTIELRYFGQEHALEVPLERGIAAPEIRRRFEALHEACYGHTTSDSVQTVTLRLYGIGLVEKPELRPVLPHSDRSDRSDSPRVGSRDAFCFAHRRLVRFDLYRRDRFQPGDQVPGPAIVDEGTSTTVVHSDQTLSVDPYGHLIIHSTT